VRQAVRTLRRALDKRSLARPSIRPAAPSNALLIAEDARAFSAPGSPPVKLDRKRAVRLILKRLMDQRLKAPGEALSADALFEAGWPGERVLVEAGAGRVYVALATLRRLGLRGSLLSRDGGYLLDPRVPLVVLTDL
jgi:hypothetical protein